MQDVFRHMTLLTIAILVLAVEAVTEIFTSSELTEPFRQAWKQHTYPLDRPPPTGIWQYVKVWFDKLISCGYCTSVWTAAFFAIWAPTLFEHTFVNWLCFVFVLHRLANWVHVTFELVKKGRVKTHDLEVLLKMQDDEEDSENENGIPGESTSKGAAEAGSVESAKTGDGLHDQ